MKLKPGDKAPDFITTDESGNKIRLSDLKGKKIVLFFYPKDMTPGCTAEACNLRDNYNLLQQQGYEVLGISTDSAKSHQKFIAKEKLPFRLLSDTDKSVHAKYNTWVEKSMYGRKYMGTARTTFVINEKGIIEDVIEKVDTKNHTLQIVKDAPIPLKKSSTTALQQHAVKKNARKKAKKQTPAKKRKTGR